MSNGTAFGLRAAKVLDDAGAFTGPVDVLVQDGAVVSLRGAVPEGVQAMDASGLWLMPGIVDCHVHLGSFFDESLEKMMSTSITRWTTEALRNARELLAMGITLGRDPGSCDAGIRDGIGDGAVPGPTLKVSGTALSQTGGHTDGYIPSLGAEAYGGFLVPDHLNRGPYRVDGVEAMRRAIRELLRLDVDWIKLCTTGGLLSTGRDHPLRQEFSREEVEVALEEAGRAGIPTCAHAYGGPGLDIAVESGARSIEHGLHITEEQAAKRAEAGCWLVPTLVVVDQLAELAAAGELSPYVAEKVREVQELSGRQVQIARAAGVRIAVGSDLIGQGRNLAELPLLAAAGMPAGEVLLSATQGGAELLGLGDTHGRIAPGFVFDAILLDRDPSNLELFREAGAVSAVFQGGAAVLPHARWRAQGLPLPEVTIG